MAQIRDLRDGSNPRMIMGEVRTCSVCNSKITKRTKGSFNARSSMNVVKCGRCYLKWRRTKRIKESRQC